MKTDCSIVSDLLPLYVEDLVSAETAEYIDRHVAECPQCQAELAGLKEGAGVPTGESKPIPRGDTAKPFKRTMKRMSR